MKKFLASGFVASAALLATSASAAVDSVTGLDPTTVASTFAGSLATWGGVGIGVAIGLMVLRTIKRLIK